MTSQLHRAAERLVEDPSDRSAYSLLIEGLYHSIERGIASALASYEASAASAYAEICFLGFVDERLQTKSFLRALAESKSPKAYASMAARNFVRDQVRKQPIDELAKEDQGDWGDPAEQTTTDTFTPVLVAAEEQAARVEWFSELPIDDQLLLSVIYVGEADLPEEQVRLIAQRRGEDVGVVRSELDSRASAHDEKYRELADELNERAGRIAGLYTRLARVSAAIRELDGHRADPGDELSSKQLERIRSSQSALRAASPQERSAYLLFLETKISKLYELQRTARAKQAEEFPAGKRWEEVLAIMGQLPDDEQARKKAVNALTQRYKRLRKRLRRKMGKEAQV